MERVFALQDAMDRAQVSRPELAKKLGVSLPMVHYWATGKKVPSARRLPKIAEALACSIDELFCDYHTAQRRPRPCRKTTRISIE